jgi:hypothetical protein
MKLTVRCLMASCLLAAGAAGEAGVVLCSRGAVQDAQLALMASGVRAGGTTVAWGDLAAFALPRQIASGTSGGVVTRDGAILRGLPIDTDQGLLRWSADRQGARSDPLAGLAALILGPFELAELPGLLAGGPGARLHNGEAIAGTLTYLNAEAVGLDTGRRVAQLPRGRVAAIVLGAPNPVAAPRFWLVLANGERVLEEGLAAVSPEAVVAGYGEGPGQQLLTAIIPTRATAIDRLGAALPVRPGAGFPTLVGGLATPHGLRLPARGEIAWNSAGASRLVAWVACPAGAEATRASVALDGTVVWEQTLQPGAAAVALAVPLGGAAEVALRAGAAADGETGLRQVLWGMPMLLR